MKAIIHSSGGADLDVITAAASDVRKGKVIVDRDGNPLTGLWLKKELQPTTGRTMTR